MKNKLTQILYALVVLLCANGAFVEAYADGFTASTADNPTWYVLRSDRTSNNVITSQGVGSMMIGSTTTSNYTRKQLWRIEQRSDNNYNIVNMADEYIDPSQKGFISGDSGNQAFKPTSSAPNTGWTITETGSSTGKYTIVSSSSIQLHQGEGGNNYYVIDWGSGSNTTDPGCLFSFEEVSSDEISTAYGISSVTALPGLQTLAPGNKSQVLLKASVTTSGYVGTCKLKSLTFSFSSETTNASADLENVRAYLSSSHLYYGYESLATEIGTVASVNDAGTATTVNITSDTDLPEGTSFLFVVADTKSTATVGDKVDIVLDQLTYDNSSETSKVYSVNSNPEGVAYIYPVQSTVFKHTDEGAKYWRIPSMVVLKHQTTAQGSHNGRIVTIADWRAQHEGDLPNFTKLYGKYSDDNGKTWSSAECVAGTDDDKKLVKHSPYGFGDAALVETSKGRIIALMSAGNGIQSGQSTHDDPIEPFYIYSDDGGATWSAPKSLYETVYNDKTYKEGTLRGTFTASGRGICLQRQTEAQGSHNGRVMFAMAHSFANSTYFHNYVIYSDDEGETWNLSDNYAYDGGDESKLVELKDGTVMISVRQSGARGFNTSNDGGVTWNTQYTNSGISGNACNADILYYGKRVLIHSYINNSSRKNVSIAVSFDNGQTWTTKHTVCQPLSCYSTMDITSNGNIAFFFEDASYSYNASGNKDGYLLNYIEIPYSMLVSGDPEKEAYAAAVASAKSLIAKGGYKNPILGKAGQCSEESINALSELISQNVTDYDAAATAIESAITAAQATDTISIPGFSNKVYFTISSYENITGNNNAPIYLSNTGAIVTSSDDAAQWQFPLNTTRGLVNIKLKDADTYLYRSGNTAAVSSAKKGWTITHNDAGYFCLQATHYGTSYLVVDKTSSSTSLNYWNSESGTNQWSTKFVLTPVAKEGVDMETHKVYNVKFVGAPQNAYVTYGKDEAAADGGVLFLTTEEVNSIAGTQSEGAAQRTFGHKVLANTTSTDEEGFVIHEADEYKTSVALKDATLTVTYSLSDEAKLQNAITEAEAVLAKKGVGYPTEANSARTTLQSAINTAKAVTSAQESDVTTLETAITTYKSVTTDIQMPEDGKAYTITAVTKSGTKSYMYYAESGYALASTTAESNSEYPLTATLICRKTNDGKYAFVNNDGKYFIWKGGQGGQNSNKGYTDTYTSDWDLTVAKMVKGNNANVDQNNFFGYVTMTGLRTNNQQNYFVIKNATAYDQANAAFYDDSFSSALLIEEVSYPNVITFADAQGVTGANYIATFSAPFATVVPEGVTAYYVNAANDVATTQAITSDAIPAKQGVLLVSTNGETATMKPATTETATELSGNLLAHSAGATHTIAASDNAYILASVNSNVAFYPAQEGTVLPMNRSYLSNTSAESAIALNFADTATAIHSALSGNKKAQPVYDLSGRRVSHVLKGGVYIQNGKKFIR